MKAVRFDSYGGIDVLKVEDVAVPEPGQGEAQVKVKAASINPGEAKIREGMFHAFWPATFPSGQGTDFAGFVTKVGPGVSEAKDTRHINRCEWQLLAGGWCSSIQDGTGHLECRAPSSGHR